MEKGEAIKAKGDELIEKFDGNIDHCVMAVEEIIKVYEYIDEKIIKRQEEYRPIEEYDYWNKALNYLKSKL